MFSTKSPCRRSSEGSGHARRRRKSRSGAARRLVLEALEDRRLLATYVWDGGGGDTLWSNLANWDVGGTPPSCRRVPTR